MNEKDETVDYFARFCDEKSINDLKSIEETFKHFDKNK
jgi:hypothetical protein